MQMPRVRDVLRSAARTCYAATCAMKCAVAQVTMICVIFVCEAVIEHLSVVIFVQRNVTNNVVRIPEHLITPYEKCLLTI